MVVNHHSTLSYHLYSLLAMIIAAQQRYEYVHFAQVWLPDFQQLHISSSSLCNLRTPAPVVRETIVHGDVFRRPALVLWGRSEALTTFAPVRSAPSRTCGWGRGGRWGRWGRATALDRGVTAGRSSATCAPRTAL